MKQTRHFLSCLGLLTVMLVASSLAACPYEDCDCNGVVINCQSMGFDQMPLLTKTTDTYTRLRIHNNKITEIPEGSLPANLVEIDFGDNPISMISPAAFGDSALTLQTLSFSNAPLTALPEALKVIQGLKSLTFININFQQWDVSILQHIGRTLNVLALNNVGLTSWPDWFSYFSNLTTLRFTNDPVSSLPDTALSQVDQTLTTFSLASANLSTVPKAVASLNRLETLDLNGNNIVEVANLPQQAKLSALYLGRNQISDVYTLVYELSAYSDSLNFLYLDGNKLTQIPRLSHLTSLLTVNLRDNLIADIGSGSFPPSVSVLMLTDNNLKAIPDIIHQMSGLSNLIINNNVIQEIRAADLPHQLRILDIRDNRITQITNASFPFDSGLTSLHLSGNPISFIDPSAFNVLSRLRDLQLQDTHLTRVPLALATLSILTSLDLRQNSIICTCKEASLVTWFKSLPGMVVEGGCGELTIAEFYESMANSCPAPASD